MKKLFIALMIFGGLSYFAINAATTATSTETTAPSSQSGYTTVCNTTYAVYNEVRDVWEYGWTEVVEKGGNYYAPLDGYIKLSINPYTSYQKERVKYKWYCKIGNNHYFIEPK
ncbi:MAG: hypothetical protein K2J17_07610 [Paramuribaculum sp.]|nr:hypothetical protein [Paramuribaculum sp.]